MAEFDDHGIADGVWSGRLRASEPPGRICVICRGEPMAEAAITGGGDGVWDIALELPAALISDGVTSLILILDDSAQPGQPTSPQSVPLARVSLVAGSPLEQDAAAEIAALRAELELLKREFRRFAIGAQG